MLTNYAQRHFFNKTDINAIISSILDQRVYFLMISAFKNDALIFIRSKRLTWRLEYL